MSVSRKVKILRPKHKIKMGDQSFAERAREFLGKRNIGLAKHYINKALKLDPLSGDLLNLAEQILIAEADECFGLQRDNKLSSKVVFFDYQQQYHLAILEISKAPREWSAKTKEFYKIVLKHGLQNPSEKLLRLLLQPAIGEIFIDMALELEDAIKSNLLEKIKKLTDVTLKQQILRDAQKRETFFGRFFASHRGGIVKLLAEFKSPEEKHLYVDAPPEGRLYPALPRRLVGSKLKEIQAPTVEFFQSLLQVNSCKVFADIKNTDIDTKKWFAEINKLADVSLKQNLLCQMLLKDTFLGRVFVNFDFGKICATLNSTVPSKKKTLELSSETREMLRNASELKAALLAAQYYRLYKIIFTYTLDLGVKFAPLPKAEILPPADAAVDKRVDSADAKESVRPVASVVESIDFKRDFLRKLLESDHLHMFLYFMLKPPYWKHLTSQDVNKKQLLDFIKKLVDPELKQAVLRQALLPETFFNKVFASDQVEVAELFIAEVGFEKALADEAIKLVLSGDDFRGKLAQQNPARYRELQILLGDPIMIVVPATSTAVACRSLALPLALVTHADEATACTPSKREMIKPGCDGSQPAAPAAQYVADRSKAGFRR